MLTKDDASNSIEKVKIYNPKSGNVELKEIGEFAQEQENNEVTDLSDLSNPNDIEQIIMVNFDESNSNDTENSIPKLAFSNQLLSIFSQLTEKSYLGLVSFSNDIKLISQLNLSKSAFEEGINKIELNSTTSSSLKLWDSIMVSINEIVKLRTDELGNDKFEYSKSRILIISSAIDNGSTSKVDDVVKSLKTNKIIVDSIIINNSTSAINEGKKLCAVCYSTGGFSFKINSIDEGNSLFNKQAFLNITNKQRSEKYDFI